MHELLAALLQANLAAGAAIAAVLVLRRPVRDLLGAQTAYVLWLLVPLVVAVSFAPPRPADLLPAPPIASAPLGAVAERTVAALAAPAPAGLDPGLAVAVVWLAGLSARLAWLVARQRRFLRLLRAGRAGPAVVGFLTPRIVTPADFKIRFDAREQAVVLAHERVHLARHDARFNALAALLRCICWFNPLVQLGGRLMRVDQELACDAAVVARHPRARAPYAQALLKAQLAAHPLPLGCYWPPRGQHPLTLRIALLKRAPPSRRRRIAGALVLVLTATGAGYAAWAAAPAAAPAVAQRLAAVESALARQPARAPARASSAKPRTQPVRRTQEPASAPVDLERYDLADPVWVRGVIVRVDYVWPTSALWVYGRGAGINGADRGVRLWRIDGGPTEPLSAQSKASSLRNVGREIVVIGDSGLDASCAPVCRLKNRVAYLVDKRHPPPDAMPDCSDDGCPVPPSAADVAAALARSEKMPVDP